MRQLHKNHVGSSHLALDLLQQLLQLPFVRLPGRPTDAEPFGLVRLRNQVEVHMVDYLMCNAPVVL